MLVSFIIIQILKGNGDGKMTGIIKCSPVDWFLFALLLAIAAFLSGIGVFIVRRSIKEKERVGLPIPPGGITLEPIKLMKLMFFAFFSAFCSAGLGVDLGLLLAPALLHMGMDPIKALETETYMAAYSSLAATILRIILNLIDYRYAGLTIIMALSGAVGGIFFQDYL